MTSPTFAEIEILGSLWPHHLEPGTPIGNGNARVDRVVVAGDVLAAIDRAGATGARVILLVIESEGGALDAGFEIYNRLRAFSSAGGRVVAFVQGRCGSIGPVIAQAADVVLMRGNGKFLIHSAHSSTDRGAERANQVVASVLAQRTGMALAKLEAYCSEVEVACQIHDLGAVRLGWADWTPCTIEYARQLAGMLARGGMLPETARSRWLATSTASAHGQRLAAAPLPQLDAHAVAHFTGSNESMNYLPPGGADVATGTVGGLVAAALSTWIVGAIPYKAAGWSGVVEMTTGANAGRIVAVGAGSPAAYSDTQGRTWVTATIPAANYTTVCFGGPAGLVAVGINGAVGAIATSPTGATWTDRSPGFPSAGPFASVKWNGARYVAVGSPGVGAWSTDGITWTLVTLPTVNASNAYQSVDWSPTASLWLAVGSSGASATSPDGNTWTGRGIDTVNFPNLRGIAWSTPLGLFSIVAQGGLAYTSTDGIAWHKTSIPNSLDCLGVVWAGRMFIASVANSVSGDLITWSYDGANWTTLETRTNAWLGGLAWIQGTIPGGSRIIAVGRTNGGVYDPECAISGQLP